jgi:putative transposase
VLLEQQEHWQLEGHRIFSAESVAVIPELEDLPTLNSAPPEEILDKPIVSLE